MGTAWCPQCRGRGEAAPSTPTDDTWGPSRSTFAPQGRSAWACPTCDGTGLVACSPRCAACQGSGHVLGTVAQAQEEGLADGRDDDFPLANTALLVLTFLSFAVEVLVPNYRFHFWLNGQQALHGQWWQFVTSLFLHDNLLQLGFNMLALYVFGPPLERTVGAIRFTLLYVIGGILGNMLSVWVNPYIQTVGGSGAIFGVAGAWIGLQIRYRIFAPRVVGGLVGYLVFMLVLGFSADVGLNNQAHLGGLVSGLLFGLLQPAPHKTNAPTDPSP